VVARKVKDGAPIQAVIRALAAAVGACAAAAAAAAAVESPAVADCIHAATASADYKDGD
jgi:hypothetical protein